MFSAWLDIHRKWGADKFLRCQPAAADPSSAAATAEGGGKGVLFFLVESEPANKRIYKWLLGMYFTNAFFRWVCAFGQEKMETGKMHVLRLKGAAPGVHWPRGTSF
jgi:hypothetical protein